MSREEEGEESQLGELSENLFNERGGFPEGPPAEQFVSGKHVPPDIAYQQKIDADIQKRGRIGTVIGKTRVTSTFDALPINARDFYEIGRDNINQVTASKNSAEFTFTVPDGFVGILRGIKWSINTVDAPVTGPGIGLPDEFWFTSSDETDGANFKATVLVNNVSAPNFSDINEINIFQNDWIPCYIIAEPLQIITLKIAVLNLDSPATTSEVNNFWKMYMRGNLLESRGLPANYEPGNLPGGGG